jgi:hypothetical protein
VGPGQTQFHPLTYANLQVIRRKLVFYLNVHILTDYFLRSVRFSNFRLVLFCKDRFKQRSCAPLWPRLNTLLFLVKMQILLELGENSDPARPMCAGRSYRQTKAPIFYVEIISAVGRTRLKMHCSSHLLRATLFLTSFSRFLIIIATKICEALNHFKIDFKFNYTSYHQFFIWYMFSISTKITFLLIALMS